MELERSLRADYPAIKPHAKVWLEVNDDYVFGLGISEILKAVEATGSIKDAAEQVGKSYRHVWSRIKQAEHALCQTLVETQQGGGPVRRSGCTPEAHRLIAKFEKLRAKVFQATDHEFDAL